MTIIVIYKKEVNRENCLYMVDKIGFDFSFKNRL